MILADCLDIIPELIINFLKRRLWKGLCITMLLSSCYGTRYLQDGEYLLREQKLVGNTAINDEQLEPLYQQGTNKKFPLIPFYPYVWIYHLGQSFYNEEKTLAKKQRIEEKYESKIAKKKERDKKVKRLERKRDKKLEKINRKLKEGNWLIRWGEPISTLDSANITKTATQIETYYITHGYFSASVEPFYQFTGKKVSINYQILEGRPHIIDTIKYQITDPHIDSLVRANLKKGEIKKGKIYNQSDLAKERDRLEKVLQNNGYYAFSKQYINFQVDTTNTPYKASIGTYILNPKEGKHKIYNIDSINFVTDAAANMAGTGLKRTNENYEGINFQYFEDEYSTKILERKVFLRKNEPYSRKNTIDTQRELANLNNFKFVNINFDSTGNKFVANIYTSPMQKYQTVNEVGVNVTEGFPGPFYNLTLIDRNVFKGLENLELSGYVGFEGVYSATETDQIYGSIDAGGKLGLNFPQLIIPNISNIKERLARRNPRTRLDVGYNYTNRPEYIRSNLNSSYSFRWQKLRKVDYQFTLSEINLIDSRNISDNFRDYLDTLFLLGNNLARSFEPSFVSSMNFSANIFFNPTQDQDRKASLMRVFAESGGLTFNFVRPEALIDQGLEYYQFVKGSFDYRIHRPVGQFGVWASRFQLGIAVPYGSNRILPYEKNFFSGGSNSVRAWTPRRLGPGGAGIFLDETDGDGNRLVDYSIEQPGDILIEANIEYRSRLVGFLDWAVFVDVGNVWKLYPQEGIPLANFEFDRFWKEFGIGTGFGLRLNFSFLVIRFDYGMKLYEPAMPEGERWVGDNYSLFNLNGKPGQTVWNIAIGYPF
jgi:outer membrane protein insertion porin family